MILVLELAVGAVTIVTDCEVIFDAYGEGEERCKRSANADLWERFWAAWHGHRGTVVIRWTKAHAQVRDLVAGRTDPLSMQGNAAADAFAGRGAA